MRSPKRRKSPKGHKRSKSPKRRKSPKGNKRSKSPKGHKKHTSPRKLKSPVFGMKKWMETYSPKRTPNLEEKKEKKERKRNKGSPSSFIFPDDISRLITGYLPKYEFQPWVDPSKLTVKGLVKNPNPSAINLLLDLIGEEKLLTKKNLSKNPSDIAVNLLLKHPEKINYELWVQNTNPRAAMYVLQNPSMLNALLKKYYKHIIKNPAYFEFFSSNPEKIDWRSFTLNPGIFKPVIRDGKIVYELYGWIDPRKLTKELLLLNPSKGSFDLFVKLCGSDYILEEPQRFLELMKNPSDRAIDFIKQNKDSMNIGEYSFLAENTNPRAMEIWDETLPLDHILKNPNAVPILAKSDLSDADWNYISENPGIFTSKNTAKLSEVYSTLQGLKRARYS